MLCGRAIPGRKISGQRLERVALGNVKSERQHGGVTAKWTVAFLGCPQIERQAHSDGSLAAVRPQNIGCARTFQEKRRHIPLGRTASDERTGTIVQVRVDDSSQMIRWAEKMKV
jgi:hypothetical protein